MNYLPDHTSIIFVLVAYTTGVSLTVTKMFCYHINHITLQAGLGLVI